MITEIYVKFISLNSSKLGKGQLSRVVVHDNVRNKLFALIYKHDEKVGYDKSL